ncbi:MAG TPA: Gldg family protein [Candidatus Eisenbacteria bacterium]
MNASDVSAARRKRRLGVLLTLALLAANLAAFNAILSRWSSARIDLTGDRMFSISPATRRLLGSLDDDLTITGYFSKRTHPKLAPLVPQIEDLLEEYRALSRGRLHVEILDPGGNDRVEREASERYGVTSTPFRIASKYESGIVNAYFAVVVKYGDQYVRYGFDDLIEVDPLPDGDVDVRLRNLEYDLTRAVKKVVLGFRGTGELFDRLGKPVRLTAVMTPDQVPEILKGVPDALRKAAAALGQASHGRFQYEEIVPASADQQADVARRFGARPMSAGLFSNQTFYLQAFLAVGDRLEQLPLTSGQVSAAGVREAIEGSLRRQAPGFLKTVGVVTSAPSIPPEVMMQLRMQGRMPPTAEFDQVKNYLRQDYNVKDVSLDGVEGVPGDVDVLLVLKPVNLKDRAVYALDQYLMRGGRAIVCSGSYQADVGAGGLAVTPVDTGLEGWLQHNGVQISRTLLLDDRNQALPIPQIRRTMFGAIQTWEMRPYPYLVEIRDAGLQNRTIAGKLEAVGIYWGSPIDVSGAASRKLRVVPILSSSDRSWTDDDPSRAATVSYTVPPGTRPHLVAAALQGSFDSYFAGKPVPPAPGDSSHREVAITRSPETRLVVVGDAEFVSDLVARALGRQVGGFFVQNLGFVQNLIDWMNLDDDLIAIRSRTGTARRLAHLGQGREIALEVLNYVIPLAALGAFGLARAWRRRAVAPVVAVGSRTHGPPRGDA